MYIYFILQFFIFLNSILFYILYHKLLEFYFISDTLWNNVNNSFTLKIQKYFSKIMQNYTTCIYALFSYMNGRRNKSQLECWNYIKTNWLIVFATTLIYCDVYYDINNFLRSFPFDKREHTFILVPGTLMTHCLLWWTDELCFGKAFIRDES